MSAVGERRLLILVNEQARNGRRALDRVRRAVPAGGYDLVPVYGMPPPRFDRYGRLLVVGGDGSVHRVASLLQDTPPLGLIPAGTGNNLSKELGIPQRLDEALALALSGTAVRRLDVLVFEGTPDRCCVLTQGALGFGAEVAARYARLRARALGRFCCYPFGEAIYRLFSLYHLVVMPRRGYGMTISIGGRRIRGTFGAVFLGNTAGLGGRFFPCPGAEPDDGLVHLCLIEGAPSRLEALRLMQQVAGGTHVLSEDLPDSAGTLEVPTLNPERVTVFRSAGPVSISFDGDLPPCGLLADGDLFPIGRDLSVTVAPGRLPVVVPG